MQFAFHRFKLFFFLFFFFLSFLLFFLFYLRKFTCSTYAVKLNANAVIQVGIFLCSDCLVLHVGSCPSYIFMCSSRLGQNKSPAPACLMRRAVPECILFICSKTRADGQLHSTSSSVPLWYMCRCSHAPLCHAGYNIQSAHQPFICY